MVSISFLLKSKLKSISLVLISISVVSSCLSGGGGGSGSAANLTPIANASVVGCFLENYPQASNSDYILPYVVGQSFTVSQGNCGAFTHQPMCNVGGDCGDIRYAYDHDTPIGMIVIASRGGTIISVVDNFPNGTQDPSKNNFISIRHDDGTVGRYLHLNPNSAMVSLGDIVSQGDPIALSGDSGNTGLNNPHIHFDVVLRQSPTCMVNVNFASCITLPIAFRNANPADVPLIEGSILYEAEIF